MLMGYLLKEALKTLCGVNQWSYAVFWKLGCQNPKLLIWEEYYCETVLYSGPPRTFGTMNSESGFDNFDSGWASIEASTSQLPAPTGNKVHSLVNKMMMENQLNVVGEGLVGRAAFTGNHQWILSEKYTGEGHPPQVLKEVLQQFSAGMQTVAVIPILPHGVVQLGSHLPIMENPAIINDVKSLILQLGCVPGILLSDKYSTEEPAPKIGTPVHPGTSVCAINSATFIDGSNYQTNSAHCGIGQLHDKLKFTGSTFQASNMARDLGKSHDAPVPGIVGSLTKQKAPLVGGLLNGVAKAEVIHSDTDVWSSKPSLSILRSTFQQQSSSQHLIGLFNNIGMGPAGSGLQHGSSSKTEESLSHLMDNLSTNHLVSGHHSADNTTVVDSENVLFQATVSPLPHHDELLKFNEHIPDFAHDDAKLRYDTQITSLQTTRYEDEPVQHQSGEDLFDVLGVAFRNKMMNGGWNNYPNNGCDSTKQNFDKNKSESWTCPDAASDLYSVTQGNSESGVFSAAGPDHLLEAMISRVHPSSKQSLDDTVSCKTSLTNMSSSSVPDTSSSSYSRAGVSGQMQGEIFGLPQCLSRTGSLGSCSFRSGSSKDNTGTYSQSSSIYGSQISSWGEQSNDIKQSSSVSTAYSKKPEETGKTNRKRLKPGENPRPRPKDRQMIQDRVKELREIVPNGAKCSIDALLERTIKHMLFLQSVTKHADKLKQTGESKMFGKEGGLLHKDNLEGGATWAYEVGSQSMVCPIVVEDLNQPRQMLVEMLCEERGLFLEIADIIRGLGLTILKGVMETRNDKIWAQFIVEANRDVTRMEIFISLVHLLEQTAKTSPAPTNCINNDNLMAHQFHHTASLPATSNPCGLP